MGRWEPGAMERLIAAALELFERQGYEATTTAQIAERAGLTKTTFFRHFRDKREVLFAGQGVLIERATAAVDGAAHGAAPLDLGAAALDALAAAHPEERRADATRIGAVIAAHDELRERAVFKRSAIAEAVARALTARGVDAVAAGLVAELAVRAYYTGFDRWAADSRAGSLPELCRAALDELRAAAASVTAR
ncbi:helix-turn-helix domain-containing protein [Gryllotalpicola koreensis]|uniref:TetR/AcrR family transcriptional regulator n=1 Tax=Gryllotalpicola koreensis TaxID=993086 RepID=A0ABP8A446_9MICO